MKLQNRTILSAAIAVAGIATVSSAQAFDTVNWVWDATVTSSVITDATATTDLVPEGLAQTENMQSMLGGLTATSLVTAVDNNLIVDLVNSKSIDDLGSVESVATAVGNNASIEADVSMQTDSVQEFAGADVGVPISGLDLSVGLPGVILATSDVIGVLNASVDSDATGVANNLSLDLSTTSLEDGLAITNSEQLALALVTTASTVDVVAFENFGGLGTTDVPSVSSAATSVGNNLSVKVDTSF